MPARQILWQGVNVTSRVLRQVIGAHEAAEANRTLKGLLAGVDLSVAAELVGAGEAFAAVFPSTVVRALPAVRPQMCGQVRLLFVGLAAAWLRALMRPQGPGKSRDGICLARTESFWVNFRAPLWRSRSVQRATADDRCSDRLQVGTLVVVFHFRVGHAAGRADASVTFHRARFSQKKKTSSSFESVVDHHCAKKSKVRKVFFCKKSVF